MHVKWELYWEGSSVYARAVPKTDHPFKLVSTEFTFEYAFCLCPAESRDWKKGNTYICGSDLADHFYCSHHQIIDVLRLRSQPIQSLSKILRHPVLAKPIYTSIMRFSVPAIIAAFSFGTHIVAAPARTSVSAKRDDFVTSIQNSFTQMSASVSDNASALSTTSPTQCYCTWCWPFFLQTLVPPQITGSPRSRSLSPAFKESKEASQKWQRAWHRC